MNITWNYVDSPFHMNKCYPEDCLQRGHSEGIKYSKVQGYS